MEICEQFLKSYQENIGLTSLWTRCGWKNVDR